MSVQAGEAIESGTWGLPERSTVIVVKRLDGGHEHHCCGRDCAHHFLGVESAGDQPHLAASKGGVEVLTRTTVVELAPYGIRVNALVPGLIATFADEPDWSLRRRDLTVPLGRGGTAGGLTGPALFLVSDDAAYVTENKVVVD